MKEENLTNALAHGRFRSKDLRQRGQTLKPVAIEENFEDLVDSSGERGNKLATKAHLEALRSS